MDKVAYEFTTDKKTHSYWIILLNPFSLFKSITHKPCVLLSQKEKSNLWTCSNMCFVFYKKIWSFLVNKPNKNKFFISTGLHQTQLWTYHTLICEKYTGKERHLRYNKDLYVNRPPIERFNTFPVTFSASKTLTLKSPRLLSLFALLPV